MKIEIKKINLKENTQSRVEINQNTVDEYAADLKEGAKFPPVVLYKNEKSFYIGDGWHRILALKKAGEKSIDAEIKQGSKRDAVLYSVGSNAAHGLRRTNEDKRKAVTLLLEDDEWAQWSNREIAKQCGVAHPFVGKLRKEVTGNRYQSNIRKGADGRTINTANIGQNAKKAAKRGKPETLETTKVLNNDSLESDVSGYRKFSIFGWDILIRKSQSKKSKKIMRHSEA